MEEKKIMFFTRIKRAIFNPESYSIFIMEKPKNAIGYLLKIMIISTIIISACMIYYMYTKDWFDKEFNEALELYNYSEVQINIIKETYSNMSDIYKILIIINAVYFACTISAFINALVFGIFRLDYCKILWNKITLWKVFYNCNICNYTTGIFIISI